MCWGLGKLVSAPGGADLLPYLVGVAVDPRLGTGTRIFVWHESNVYNIILEYIYGQVQFMAANYMICYVRQYVHLDSTCGI